MPTNTQQIVRRFLTAAIPGQIVQAEESYNYITEGITGDDSCVLGGVIKDDAGKLYGAAHATGRILGIGVFDRFYSGEAPNMNVPANTVLKVLQNGIIAIQTPIAAVRGQNVGINDTTGAWIFKDAPSTWSAGTTFTGFHVTQGCEADGIAFIKDGEVK